MDLLNEFTHRVLSFADVYDDGWRNDAGTSWDIQEEWENGRPVYYAVGQDWSRFRIQIDEI